MAETKTLTVPFGNLGIRQKIDPGQLTAGQFKDMVNVLSVQEGSLSSRNGTKLLGSISGASLPHTGFKLRVNAATSYGYIGEGQDIWRSSAQPVGGYVAFTKVNGASVVPSGESIAKRWRAAPYSAGTSGDPYMYFACPSAMLKDNGRAPFNPLRNWGIRPPSRPATAVSVAITPRTINASPTVLTFTTTTAYETATIESGAINLSTFPDGTKSGDLLNGYDSNDPIELELELNIASVIQDIRLQLDVSGGSDVYVDYYEKPIITSTLTGLVQTQTQPVDALTTRQEQVNLGVSGDSGSTDPTTQGFIPVQLSPASTLSKTVLRISKADFGKVGRAGNVAGNTLNWAAVKNVRVTAKVSSIASSPTLKVNYIRLAGGSGPDSSAATSTAYEYVYTFRDTKTNQESNPSQPMIPANFVNSDRDKIRVTVGGTNDANISTGANINSIAIYRRGGVFVDKFYRLVGYATNPGASGTPSTTTFDDTASDDDIKDAPTAQFDNDPPVLSSLPTPFDGIMQGFFGGGTGAIGWNDFNLDQTTAGVITDGSTASIGIGLNQEFVTIWTTSAAVLGGSQAMRCYFQKDHSGGGDKVIISAVCGWPCSLVAQAGDNLYLAGDSNNPHILYKSKTGRPDAFPLKENDSGIVEQVNVGSPANPIMNITEFNGDVVCLNLEKLYQVRTFQGAMQTPIETPAQRGLISRHAWCKADNELWYLGFDGIYSWSGGQATKRSEQIDWMFRNRIINGINPIDLGQINANAQDYCSMAYHNSEILFTYRESGGNTRRLRYATLYDRWFRDDEAPTMMFVEQDTGRLICGQFNASGGQIFEDDVVGTDGASDLFTGPAGTNGTAIAFDFTSGFFTAGEPTVQKIFQDVILEISNPGTTITVRVFYDFSAAADATDTFTIAPAAGRRRFPIPLQSSGSPATTSGKEAYAMAFQFTGSGTQQTVFHSLTFNYFPLEQIQRGRIGDWTDVGHPYDKRFYEVTLEYDTKGTTEDLLLDVITGIDGSTITLGVQTLSLTGAGRAQRTLPIIDGIVAKKVRLRPKTAAADFVFFGATFKVENYPPDIIGFTEYDSYGHPYDKHFQQLWLDVDTNGQDIPVTIQGDGTTKQTITVNSTGPNRSKEFSTPVSFIAKKCRLLVGTIPSGGKFQLFGHRFDKTDYPPDSVQFTEYTNLGTPFDKYLQQAILDVDTNGIAISVQVDVDGSTVQTLSVTGTQADRVQRITLNPGLKGKQIRLKIPTIAGGGKFQLFSSNFTWRPADEGEISHTNDWDDLGYPYDKQLMQVTIKYDNHGQSAITVRMDTIAGTPGTAITTNAQSFVLTGAGRSEQTFPINDGIIAKAVRLQATSTNVGFQEWSYKFTKIDYPPDIVSFTEFSDEGYAFDKIYQQVLLDVDTNGANVNVNIEGESGVLQSIVVNGTFANRRQNIVLSPTLRAKRTRLIVTSVASGGKFQLFGHSMIWVKGDRGPVYHSYDWDFLGHNFDKHLSEIVFEYDTSGSAVTMIMDTMTGIKGQTINSAVQSFVLDGAGRSLQTFAIIDGVIVKQVRIRPQSTAPNLKVWNYSISKVDYPADIVLFTEWSDEGYPLDKIFQQLVIDVDTAGQNITVDLEADGSVIQTLTINGTGATRKQKYTLNPMLKGKKCRLKVTNVPAGGKFQLFEHAVLWMKDDKGPVKHSYDWDDLGHPYDKKLSSITFEYDHSGGNTVMLMDTISGIHGNTVQSNVQSFTLDGTQRGKQTFAIADNIIVKMIRIRPQSDTTIFQAWPYEVDKINYPKDDITWTEWENLGYPCDKILRWLVLEVDTGGVQASIDIQGDGTSRQTVLVNTTNATRNVIITLNSDIIAKEFRLVPTSGAGGKFQLFSHKFETIKEPCAITHWDSYEQVFGHNGWKFIKQFWLEYMCASPIVVRIYRDNDVLFYTKTLPVHPHRDVERFYLPAFTVLASVNVLNKSKVYRVTVDSSSAFKLYRDGTRIETKQLSDDQRAGYNQHYLWETLPIPI